MLIVLVLISSGSDLIDESKAQPRDFQEAYLDLILRMIDAGPLSSHIEYICMLHGDGDIDFKEYFQVSLDCWFTERESVFVIMAGGGKARHLSICLVLKTSKL